MASNTIKGLTVEIGGDTTKLGKALEDVNKKSRDISKELGDINRLLKLDPKNTDLLRQKQQVLADAISNTSKKLDTLKQAEKQVQEQFKRGEVSEEQVRELQREIIATEKKMDGYEKAAKETDKALRGMGDASEKAEKSSGNLGKAMDAAAKGLAAVGAAAGAALTAMAAATVDAAAYADEMLTMSTVTGMSTDDLQAFSYASELVDVSVETLTKSMGKNVKSMSSAQQGSKAYADAYKKLGVSVTDANGNLRDGETVYWEAIDALGKIENETERDAVAMQLFGKSAQELNPLIEAGSEKMKELTQEAHDVGAVLSEDALAALGAFDDSIQRLKGSAGAAKNALGAVLLPELQMLTDASTGLLTSFTTKLNASGGGLDGFISTLDSMSGEIGSTIADMASKLVSGAVSLAPSLVSVAVSLVTTLTTSLVTMIPQLITAGINILMALIQGVTQAIPQLVTAIVNMIPQLTNALVTGIPQLIVGAVQLLLAIVQAIPQILPPLVAALPQIVLSIINGLVQAIPQLIQGAVQFLTAIIRAIPLIINALIPQVPTIVTAIIEGLISCLPSLLDGAVQLLNAIIEAIPIIIQALVPQIPTIVSTIIDCLLDNLPVLLDAAVQLFMALVKAIPQVVSALARELPTIVNTVMKVLGTLGTKVLSVGKDLVTGLWNGVKNKLSWLKKKISGFASSVLDGIKSFFGIKSPSRVMRDEIGKNLALGLAEGIEKNTSEAEKAAEEMAAAVLSNAEKRLDGYKTYNDMTLADETAFWDSVRSQVKEGTDARLKADQKYLTAKKSLDQQLTAAEKEYQDALAETQKKVDDRTSAILSSMGLFEEFTAEDVNKFDLVKNLETQVDALEEWNAVLADLETKIGGTALFEEIQAQGVSALREAEAIARLESFQLERYVELYEKRAQLAREQAENELGDEVAKAEAEAYQTYIDTCEELGVAVNTANDAMVEHTKTALEQLQLVAARAQAIFASLNGQGINPAMLGSFTSGAAGATVVVDNSALLAKLDGIYERLGRLQMVTQTGALVGEIVDEMDAALAGRQLLYARGV